MLCRPEKISLLETQGKLPLEGYVIYSNSDKWWRRFLGEYAHCSLIMRRGAVWVWYQPALGFDEVVIMGNDWRDYFTDAVEVQKFRVWRTINRYRVPHLLQPITCVEKVKAFLGISSFWVLTPKQLQRRLSNG